MRITALVKRLDHVCCRYRLAAYRPYLESAGHELELRIWPKGWWPAARLHRRIGNTDVLLVQRRLLKAGDLATLRQCAEFLIYDFDDAVFIRDSYCGRHPHSKNRSRGFVHMVRSADAVVAGNAYLKDQATLWTSPDRVHVIPTYLEPGRYPLAVHKRCTSVQLVWIGSASTLPALEQIRPALEQLAQRRPDLRLKIVCDRFLEFDNLVIHRCPWSEHREVHDLADADIGISWVPDDAWSRGKCGLKILQYMAAGLPVVANPVGMQAKLVRHGETGYLARTADEWQIAIDSLADNPELRRRMGLAGRAFVERYYDLREGATRWLTLLDHLRGDKHSLPTTTRRQM